MPQDERPRRRRASCVAHVPSTLLVAASNGGCEKAALAVMDAMKMEHTITAPAKGTVKSFYFRVGDQVGDGAELVEFEVE